MCIRDRLIGHTPLLELTNYEKALGLEAKIIAKLEYFNPLGSVKDRVAAVSYTHLDVYKRQDVDKLMELVASGKVAIPANKHHKSLDAEGVGRCV